MSNIALVAANLTKWCAFGQCRVIQVHGFNNQSADRYIQFHQAPTVTAADVPAIKSLWAPNGAGFSWSFFGGGIQLTELLVAISTTEANYTAPSAGGGLDMTVVVESDFLVTSTTAIVGDLTTGVAGLQVWT